MQRVKIENWKLVENSDESKTAQKIGFRLRGYIFQHPEVADGTVVTTSQIVAINGLSVTCANRIYELGAASTEFKMLLIAHGHSFDHLNPLKPYSRWLGDN